MASLDSFTVQAPRMLPVIVAADRSGSMAENGKIEALNLALREFVDSLREVSNPRGEIHLAVYSFGGAEVTCEVPLEAISKISGVGEIPAEGMTPMGQAFKQLKDLIEDVDRVPHRAYKPTLLLISDGIPTDDWIYQLSELVDKGRSAKSYRFALAIGDDADREMLGRFVTNSEYLMTGDKARDIRKFFRWVSMSVSVRLLSQSPNGPQLLPLLDDDTLEL